MATVPTQSAMHHCDRCGHDSPYTQESPYEFAYACPCGEAGVISWSHAAPPPAFQPAPKPDQPALF